MAIEIRELVLRMRVASELRDDLSEKFVSREAFHQFEKNLYRKLDRQIRSAIEEARRGR